MKNLIALSDLDTSTGGEPRIPDLTLAERLGFERPRDVRKLIERNAIELQDHGSLATRWRKSRGQEFTEYHLNEGQALVICALSHTDRAATVRKALIEVYMAWRRGQEPSTTYHHLADDIEALARVVRAPVWSVWRNMCAANHVVNPAAMTSGEALACQAWLRMGGDYRYVPSEIWRRRWDVAGEDCSDLHRAADRLAARWRLSPSFVYNLMESETRIATGWPVLPSEVPAASTWLAGWIPSPRPMIAAA